MADEVMMQETAVVEPRAGVQAVEEQVTEVPEGGTELSDELLQVPAVQGLMAGAPGAFSAVLSTFEKAPEAKLIAANKDPLMQAGIGFYRSLDGQKGVVFNGLFVSGDEIKAADQAGQLDTVAPPFEQVNAEIAKSGAANPVLAEGERPSGMKMGGPAPAAAPIGVAANVKPLAASAQRDLANDRTKNLMPSQPAGGPKPGAGVLANQLLRPVI